MGACDQSKDHLACALVPTRGGGGGNFRIPSRVVLLATRASYAPGAYALTSVCPPQRGGAVFTTPSPVWLLATRQGGVCRGTWKLPMLRPQGRAACLGITPAVTTTRHKVMAQTFTRMPRSKTYTRATDTAGSARLENQSQTRLVCPRRVLPSPPVAGVATNSATIA